MPRVAVNSQFSLLATIFSAALMGQIPQHVRASIDQTVGGHGAYISDDGVYKIVLPREEATIVYDYQTLSPNLGLNSWVAFKAAVNHQAIVTGQLLLLDDEVNAVISMAIDAGLDVTGLASSSVFDGPHLHTLDLSGIGTFRDLAAAFRKCLDEVHQARRAAIRPKSSAPDVPMVSSIDPVPLDAVLCVKGGMAEGAYQAVIGTRALLHGEQIGQEMGMSTWISVAGTDDRAVAHGELVASTEDLQKVIKALRAKKLSIVSIRNHTVGEQPQFVFVHFLGEGRAVELARAIRYAVDLQVGYDHRQLTGATLNSRGSQARAGGRP
jgi:hypothetical protein